MTKNKLYTLLAIACFFGFAWVGFAYVAGEFLLKANVHACIFKNMTSYPCPSCGTTRSVKLLLLDGDICGAFMMNPIGIIAAIIMVVVPIWLLADVLTKRQTLFDAYIKIEKIIATKWVAIVLTALVILNWIWNIHKQL